MCSNINSDDIIQEKYLIGAALIEKIRYLLSGLPNGRSIMVSRVVETPVLTLSVISATSSRCSQQGNMLVKVRGSSPAWIRYALGGFFSFLPAEHSGEPQTSHPSII